MARLLLIFLIPLAFVHDALSQLDNSVFEDRKKSFHERSNRVYLSLDVLGFTRNNEYFNKIADGYTLFGYQLNPSISYYPSENVRIDAGVYMQKDFGNSGFQTVSPTLSIKVKRNDLSIIFGNLDGALNHKLIEPLFDFERVLVDRMETGLQAVIDKESLFLDAWINWETMIYPGDTLQEEVSGGISFDYKLLENKNVKVSLPIQTVLYHKGGQIDVSDEPLTSLMNNAIGLNFDVQLDTTGILKSISAKNYFVYYTDFSFERRLPFNNGTGIYSNLDVEFKWFDFMISYWRGNDFISIKGAPLYQSVSNNYKNPGYLEDRRELLIFRFMHDIKILDNLFLSSRFEPFFDLGNSKLEFSHGFYVNYRPDFFLFKASSIKND